jgi:hypothetical protein
MELLDIEAIELMDDLVPVDDTLVVWSTRSEKAETMLLFTSSRPRMLPAAVTSISKRKHSTFIC